jgi:hypothetical protein
MGCVARKVLRIYGPEADSFNDKWIPGNIVEIEMK